MIQIKGKHNLANVMIDHIDETTRSQIQSMVNNPCFDNYIAIQPDCHAGKGSVIGFTMELGKYVIPNVVGVDIACGMLCVPLGNIDVNLKELDDFIHKNIPGGTSIRTEIYSNFSYYDDILIREATKEAMKIDSSSNFTDRVIYSIGSLGGGNHFIEIDMDDENNKYLIIHSGSRNFGAKIAQYYQEKAKEILSKYFVNVESGYEFIAVDNPLFHEYINASDIAYRYASRNRKVIAELICNDFLKLNFNSWKSNISFIETVHNYISTNYGKRMIRKGAISAQKDEIVVIPLNMRDGTIIGRGLGNKKYNYSAPHGAGRVLARNQAKKTLKLEDFKATMEGIYSSCISEATLDESPMAYKDSKEILDNLKETVIIDKLIKPIYNFKA